MDLEARAVAIAVLGIVSVMLLWSRGENWRRATNSAPSTHYRS